MACRPPTSRIADMAAAASFMSTPTSRAAVSAIAALARFQRPGRESDSSTLPSSVSTTLPVRRTAASGMPKPQADRNDPSPHSSSAPQAGQAVASSRQSRPVSTQTVSDS